MPHMIRHVNHVQIMNIEMQPWLNVVYVKMVTQSFLETIQIILHLHTTHMQKQLFNVHHVINPQNMMMMELHIQSVHLPIHLVMLDLSSFWLPIQKPIYVINVTLVNFNQITKHWINVNYALQDLFQVKGNLYVHHVQQVLLNQTKVKHF